MILSGGGVKILEEAESVCPAVHLLVEPPQPPTHQPEVYQLRLPRETASYPALPLCFYRTALIRSIGDSLRFKVQGSKFRVQGSGFRVQGSGFRVQGSGFRVQG